MLSLGLVTLLIISQKRPIMAGFGWASLGAGPPEAAALPGGTIAEAVGSVTNRAENWTETVGNVTETVGTAVNPTGTMMETVGNAAFPTGKKTKTVGLATKTVGSRWKREGS